MGVFDVRQTIEVARAAGVVTDRFGDEHPTVGQWEQVAVFGWAVPDTDLAATGEVIARDTRRMNLYCPPEAVPGVGGKARLPDGTVWECAPASQDYSHNPWFDPGLVVVPMTRVEG